jgi:ketosteroid isomerase-like protein
MIGAIVMKLGMRRGVTALNRRDAEYFIRFLADDVVLEFPGHTPLSGRFVGRHAVADWYRRYFETTVRIHDVIVHSAVEHPFALGLSNTIITEFDAEETTARGETSRGRYIDVSEMRRGKLVAERTYPFDMDGVERAWGRVEPAEATQEVAATVAL